MREPPRKNTTQPAASASISASTKPTKKPTTPDKTPPRARVVTSVSIIADPGGRLRRRGNRAAVDRLVLIGHLERLPPVEHHARLRRQFSGNDVVADAREFP